MRGRRVALWAHGRGHARARGSRARGRWARRWVSAASSSRRAARAGRLSSAASVSERARRGGRRRDERTAWSTTAARTGPMPRRTLERARQRGSRRLPASPSRRSRTSARSTVSHAGSSGIAGLAPRGGEHFGELRVPAAGADRGPPRARSSPRRGRASSERLGPLPIDTRLGGDALWPRGGAPARRATRRAHSRGRRLGHEAIRDVDELLGLGVGSRPRSSARSIASGHAPARTASAAARACSARPRRLPALRLGAGELEACPGARPPHRPT